MNWKAILHSVIAAAAGGAISSLTAVGIDPSQFNLSNGGLKHLGLVTLTGALTGVLALLKASPLQKPCDPPAVK